MLIDDLILNLGKLGIKDGDIILVSSDVSLLIQHALERKDIKKASKKEFKKYLNLLIDQFQQLVGHNGTILFPTYSWEFCRGKTFDYKKSVGQTGVLSNIALERSDFIRTAHPIYSFAVWGKYSRELANMKNIDSWGNDSPFHFMFLNKAKNISLCTHEYCTFTHYIEEQLKVSYRYIKNFSAPYIDFNDKQSIRTYSMYVRNLDLNFSDKSDYELEDLCKAKGFYKSIKHEELELGVLDVVGACEVVKQDILYNESRSIIFFNR